MNEKLRRDATRLRRKKKKETRKIFKKKKKEVVGRVGKGEGLGEVGREQGGWQKKKEKKRKKKKEKKPPRARNAFSVHVTTGASP